ncbi:hypothetical protein J1605_011243 [Eschrichtius robustus]|uniref:Uncharacterized protein n=1 Tax=Eschrichtius robustus TaxID=9764 RepID=A0AB34GP07_ESCRO|nr:hypothetical protein J1605_011243 [Eschrichtius robustus]
MPCGVAATTTKLPIRLDKRGPPSKVTASKRSYPFPRPHHRLPDAPTPLPDCFSAPAWHSGQDSNQTGSRPGRLTPPARSLPPTAPPPSDNGARLPAANLSCPITPTSPRPRPPPPPSSPPLSFPKPTGALLHSLFGIHAGHVTAAAAAATAALAAAAAALTLRATGSRRERNEIRCSERANVFPPLRPLRTQSAAATTQLSLPPKMAAGEPGNRKALDQGAFTQPKGRPHRVACRERELRAWLRALGNDDMKKHERPMENCLPTFCGQSNDISRGLQLLKPMCLEPVLRNKRSHRTEKPAHRNEE